MEPTRGITKRARVLLADEHRILLDGLQQLLEKSFEVVGSAADGCELVNLTQRLQPDVVIANITLPRLNAIEAVEQIRLSGFSPRVVFLTVLDDPKLLLKAFQAGGDATGYLLKDSAGVELVAAIQEVISGRSYVTPRITTNVLNECLRRIEQPAELLTRRQGEVLRLIAQGMTMKEVASVLLISTRTAEAHKYQMMQQLGIKTVAHLIQFAIGEGLVPRPAALGLQEKAGPSPPIL